MPTAATPRDNLGVGKQSLFVATLSEAEFESSIMSKAKIAVIGAGLMGHGIAQVFALAGHEVIVTDTVMKNLDGLEARSARRLSQGRRRLDSSGLRSLRAA